MSKNNIILQNDVIFCAQLPSPAFSSHHFNTLCLRAARGNLVTPGHTLGLTAPVPLHVLDSWPFTARHLLSSAHPEAFSPLCCFIIFQDPFPITIHPRRNSWFSKQVQLPPSFKALLKHLLEPYAAFTLHCTCPLIMWSPKCRIKNSSRKDTMEPSCRYSPHPVAQILVLSSC